MARGARRYYGYQSGRLATVPDELCHVEHTQHAVCGMSVDPERVLVLWVAGREWLDLAPWCETCRVYVDDPTALVGPDA